MQIKDLKGLLKTLNDKKPAQTYFQLFDARFVATWEHLYFAALNALLAFRSKLNISKNLAIEILLYASGQHQIQKATQMLGLKSDSTDIAVLVVGDNLAPIRSLLSSISKNVKGKRDDEVLELSKEKFKSIQRSFRISENQLRIMKRGKSLGRALVDIVIERVALVAVQN